MYNRMGLWKHWETGMVMQHSRSLCGSPAYQLRRRLPFRRNVHHHPSTTFQSCGPPASVWCSVRYCSTQQASEASRLHCGPLQTAVDDTHEIKRAVRNLGDSNNRKSQQLVLWKALHTKLAEVETMLLSMSASLRRGDSAPGPLTVGDLLPVLKALPLIEMLSFSVPEQQQGEGGITVTREICRGTLPTLELQQIAYRTSVLSLRVFHLVTTPIFKLLPSVADYMSLNHAIQPTVADPHTTASSLPLFQKISQCNVQLVVILGVAMMSSGSCGADSKPNSSTSSPALTPEILLVTQAFPQQHKVLVGRIAALYDESVDEWMVGNGISASTSEPLPPILHSSPSLSQSSSSRDGSQLLLEAVLTPQARKAIYLDTAVAEAIFKDAIGCAVAAAPDEKTSSSSREAGGEGHDKQEVVAAKRKKKKPLATAIAIVFECSLPSCLDRVSGGRTYPNRRAGNPPTGATRGSGGEGEEFEFGNSSIPPPPGRKQDEKPTSLPEPLVPTEEPAAEGVTDGVQNHLWSDSPSTPSLYSNSAPVSPQSHTLLNFLEHHVPTLSDWRRLMWDGEVTHLELFKLLFLGILTPEDLWLDAKLLLVAGCRASGAAGEGVLQTHCFFSPLTELALRLDDALEDDPALTGANASPHHNHTLRVLLCCYLQRWGRPGRTLGTKKKLGALVPAPEKSFSHSGHATAILHEEESPPTTTTWEQIFLQHLLGNGILAPQQSTSASLLAIDIDPQCEGIHNTCKGALLSRYTVIVGLFLERANAKQRDRAEGEVTQQCRLQTCLAWMVKSIEYQLNLTRRVGKSLRKCAPQLANYLSQVLSLSLQEDDELPAAWFGEHQQVRERLSQYCIALDNGFTFQQQQHPSHPPQTQPPNATKKKAIDQLTTFFESIPGGIEESPQLKLQGCLISGLKLLRQLLNQSLLECCNVHDALCVAAAIRNVEKCGLDVENTETVLNAVFQRIFMDASGDNADATSFSQNHHHHHHRKRHHLFFRPEDIVDVISVCRMFPKCAVLGRVALNALSSLSPELLGELSDSQLHQLLSLLSREAVPHSQKVAVMQTVQEAIGRSQALLKLHQPHHGGGGGDGGSAGALLCSRSFVILCFNVLAVNGLCEALEYNRLCVLFRQSIAKMEVMDECPLAPSELVLLLDSLAATPSEYTGLYNIVLSTLMADLGSLLPERRNCDGNSSTNTTVNVLANAYGTAEWCALLEAMSKAFVYELDLWKAVERFAAVGSKLPQRKKEKGLKQWEEECAGDALRRAVLRSGCSELLEERCMIR